MINFKKGPALSLGQSDKVAKVAAGSGIEAGHLVRIDATTGAVTKGANSSTANNADLLGFAINDATAGDVLESGKMGVFLLDGASVIETDKVAGTINSTNYPIGKPLKAGLTTDLGLVTSGTPGTDRIIGYVEGIRSLPSVETVTVDGVTHKIQGTRTLLGIKLSV